MAKVVIGLSGGVDSSVAAFLLKEQGHEVIGLFMKNWHDTSVTISDECPWIDDSNDAMMVADTLGIPFQTIDLSETYKERIVDYMFAEYEAGRTPNPDVLCNREIKFDVFLKTALQLGADFVATGHYCQKGEIETENGLYFQLLAGNDVNKDQSYFLCQLNQAQLSKSLFPIGALTKPKVREIANKIGLTNANKKDSQGLCFIGKVRLPEFLQQQLKPKKGDIIKIESSALVYQETQDLTLLESALSFHYNCEMGKKVGEHQGAHYFTIGQRKGLNVGGMAEGIYVIATDTKTNTVYIGMGDNHPGLHKKALLIENKDVHWVRPNLKLEEGEKAEYLCRIRYRQPLVKVILHQLKEGLLIAFETPTKAVAPGQFAAWYLDNELVGSGVISNY